MQANTQQLIFYVFSYLHNSFGKLICREFQARGASCGKFINSGDYYLAVGFWPGKMKRAPILVPRVRYDKCFFFFKMLYIIKCSCSLEDRILSIFANLAIASFFFCNSLDKFVSFLQNLKKIPRSINSLNWMSTNVSTLDLLAYLVLYFTTNMFKLVI